jgi:Uma2 family endonuclease
MSVTLTRRRFTVDEYHRMAEVGILTPDDRVELIDGEIVEMSPIGAPHARCVVFLTEAFVRGLAGRAVISPQNSLRLGEHLEPQPDLILLRPPLARYGKRVPGPGDALLVLEVADTSQHRDRVIKLPRYAATGVPEVWIVDLEGSAVEVYRTASSDGYRSSRRPGRGDEVSPAAFSDVALAVDDILG